MYNSVPKDSACEEKLPVADQEFAYEVKEDYSYLVHGLDPKEVEKGMDREIDLLDHFQAYVWVSRTSIPKGAQIHTTDWYMKLKEDGSVRCRLCVQQVKREIDA